jgi:orotidine-5'-phosphate decarboxylase
MYIDRPEIHYPHVSPIVDKIRQQWIDLDSMAGVGIDPDPDRIPAEIWQAVGGQENLADGIELFNQQVIDATAEFAVDYKVNSNFFQGELGKRALAGTFQYLKREHPNAVRVCDGKFADVGHTAGMIAEEIFGKLDADAVLLNPYMGFDAIEPFTRWKDKAVVLCVNTSNPSAEQIQDLRLGNGDPLWKHILKVSLTEWNDNQNIIPVLSATHSQNLDGIRDQIGDTPILLAGIGTQGGDLKESVSKTLDSRGYGLMISASRAILYPEVHEGETSIDATIRAARDLRDSINTAKDRVNE